MAFCQYDPQTERNNVMARVKLDSSLSNADPTDLRSPVQTIFQQLEDQLGSSPDTYVISDDSPGLPNGIQRLDIVLNLTGTTLKIGVYNGKEVVYST